MAYKYLLLIDDDEDDQDIFQAALSENAPDVAFQYISNPLTALEQLQAGKITPEVIFLDLNMPQMSGQEVLKQLKSTGTTAPIPVIIYSTSANDETKEAVLKMGAEKFITKPEDYYQLVKILKPLIS